MQEKNKTKSKTKTVNANSHNILRGSRIKRSIRRANEFTSSIGYDGPISSYVVSINMAHMLSLMKTGEVSREVGVACLSFLNSLPGRFALDRRTEDVHHMIEQDAIKKIGMDTAGYLNFGKSRNDQVATAIRMAVRSNLLDTAASLVTLEESITSLIKEYGLFVMPGYTHLQHAQPVTLAHHLQSHFDAIQRDLERLEAAYARVNASPMGAAALAGTSVKTDRRYVASLLGFPSLVENAMDAVSTRDFLIESLGVAAITMVDLSRISEELILWSSSEFGFVEIADEFCATSSIMPQKKNPVVAETIRARSSSVFGELMASLSIAKSLPNSYNLDLQEATFHLWRGLKDLEDSVGIMGSMLLSLTFHQERMRSTLENDMSTATELANYLVERHGVPFRQAHALVGRLVRVALEDGTSLGEAVLKELPSLSLQVVGKSINIDKQELEGTLDVFKTLGLIGTEGGANPRFISRQLLKNNKITRQNTYWISRERGLLVDADGRLRREVRTIVGER